MMNQESRKANEAQTSVRNESHEGYVQQRQSQSEPQQASIVYVVEQRKPTARRWLWVIAAIVILFIVIALIWMNNVSGAVSSLQHSVHQNSQAIANQQSKLAGIKQQLNDISNALNQLGQHINTFFTQIMQAIQHK